MDHFRPLDQGSQCSLYSFRRLHILKREETKDVMFCMKRRRGGSVSHGSEEVFVQCIALLKSMLAKRHIEHIRSRKVKQGARILVLRSDQEVHTARLVLGREPSNPHAFLLTEGKDVFHVSIFF
jgi:hypothetical protein